MELVRTKLNHITEMMSWFDSQADVVNWAGPQFTYPYSTSSFIKDLKLEQLTSFSLLDQGKLVGFGQCYERLGHLHLGRLIISPGERGQGHAQKLMAAIANEGQKMIKANALSLFVYQDNRPAIQAYVRAGFAITDYPEQLPITDIIYMTKPIT